MFRCAPYLCLPSSEELPDWGVLHCYMTLTEYARTAASTVAIVRPFCKAWQMSILLNAHGEPKASFQMDHDVTVAV